MNLIKALFCLVIIGFSSNSFSAVEANNFYGVEIDRAEVNGTAGNSSYVGTVLVKLIGSPIQLSNCQPGFVIFSLDQISGPAMYSTILAAKTAGKTVGLSVTNENSVDGYCRVRWAAME